MLQTSLLLMKSLNKTETPIFLSVVCSLFPKAIFLTFIFLRLFDLRLFGFCLFPLPFGVWEGLPFVIVALPGLFSYHFSVEVILVTYWRGGQNVLTYKGIM